MTEFSFILTKSTQEFTEAVITCGTFSIHCVVTAFSAIIISSHYLGMNEED